VPPRHAPLPRLSLHSLQSHTVTDHSQSQLSRSFRLFALVSFRFRNRIHLAQHAYLFSDLSLLYISCVRLLTKARRSAQSRRDAPTRIAQVIIPRLATHLHLTAHAVQILSIILGVLEVEEPAAFMGDGRGSGRGAGGVALGEPGRGGVELGDPCLDC
jgi:hypothetical protein